ncbi:MAG: cold shock domain-containing protein [Saprospiraceae bacterium]|nr:cold shock domain-containing protein [Saprospiraceae bacterium]
MFQSVIGKIRDFFTPSRPAIRRTSQSGKVGSQAYEGVIIYFNHRKGYGFVKSPHEEDRIFLHVSQLKGKASKGKKVKFDIEKSSEGIRAINAEILA